LGAVNFRTISNATTDTDRFLVSDGGIIKYRTGAEVLSDIGGASASSISGTTNYIPKFTSSSAIGNSVIYESSGSIGIGTTNPSEKFSLYGGDAIFTQYTGTGNGSSFKIINSTTTTDGTTLQSSYFGSGGFGPLKFEVGGSEQMRLTSTGLGIGTSSPAVKLDVNGYGRFSIGIVGSSGLSMYGDASSATGLLLSTSGNLGLGVTPSAWKSGWTALQNSYGSFVSDGARLAIGYNWFLNSSSSDRYITTDYATLYQQILGQHVWYNAPSGTAGNAISFTQAMTLDASGNLGIGTTSPASLFHVSGGNITLWNSSDAIIQSVKLGALATRITTTSSALTFGVDGSDGSTERMRITSGGDVGIGTTTPGTKLEVNGAIKTAAPSGGTAKPFKIGAAATVTPTSQNRTIEIEIDGTTYYLTAKTTND